MTNDGSAAFSKQFADDRSRRGNQPMAVLTGAAFARRSGEASWCRRKPTCLMRLAVTSADITDYRRGRIFNAAGVSSNIASAVVICPSQTSTSDTGDYFENELIIHLLQVRRGASAQFSVRTRHRGLPRRAAAINSLPPITTGAVPTRCRRKVIGIATTTFAGTGPEWRSISFWRSA